MLQAMFSGVSGLQAHQTRLNVIGNNIANVNTIGFKAGRVTFQDQLSQTIRSSARPSANVGGQNPSQVGLGVALGAVDTLQTQGNLQTTGKATDLAIQGNGFFLVSSGDNVFYTRDGSFDLDSEGVLVNPASGLKLLGYIADQNGVIDTSQQVNSASVLKVPVGSLTSVKQTTASTFQGNLNASAALQSTNLNISGNLDVSQVPNALNTTVYDSLGNAHTVQIAFANPNYYNPPSAGGPGVPVGATQRWDVTLTIDGNSQPVQKLYAAGGQFIFTDTANPGNSLGSKLPINIAGTGGAPAFQVGLDFGGLTDTSSVTTFANGQNSPSNIQSTLMSLKGNLNVDTLAAAPIVNTQTVYDSAGNAFTVKTTLTNATTAVPVPAGPNVPAGATQTWNLKVEKDTVPPSGPTTLYDSGNPLNNESKAYFVPGTGFILADGANPANSLGSTVQMIAGALPPGNFNQGVQIAAGFPLTIDLSGLSTTKTTGKTDGQTGPSPIWNTSLKVFDSLGIGHLLNFKFSRALVGAGAPSAATARWEWAATEDGNLVADSATAGNKPLFFDNKGNLINTQNQNISITPKGGAQPFGVTVNFNSLTQLAGDSSVAATTQDGFAVGTLQSFGISQEGLITGIFSNGQTRTLGQMATASFSNPAGLEKLGQNLFKDSSNSGLAQVGLPNISGRGKISTGFVEMSNVDLSTEFTNLIVTERGFQANTKIITTVDGLLQDVINLKR